MSMLQLLTDRSLNIRSLCFKAGICAYYLAFIGVVIGPAFTYLCYLELSRGIFIGGLYLSVVAILLICIGSDHLSISIKKQMFLVYIIVNAVFLPFFIRSRKDGGMVYGNNLDLIELIPLSCGLLFWGVSYYRDACRKKSGFSIKKICLQNRGMFLVVTVVIVSAVDALRCAAGWVKWDAANYYKGIVRFEEIAFNPNDIGLLKLCDHACYAYSLLISIGENLVPYHAFGVRVENVIIFGIGIILFYKITAEVIQDITHHLLVGITALFAFTPIILGTIQDINPELLVLVLFLCFVYCYIKRLHVLELFFALLCIFAKETCIVILFGFYLGIALDHLICCARDRTRRFIERDFVLTSISLYLPAVLFMFYFAVDNAWGTTVMRKEISGTVRGNIFGLNSPVIISKFKYLFGINFNWIIVGTIIVCLILCILFKKKITVDIGILFPFIGSYLMFLGTQLFYITYTFPRYIMLHFFFMDILLVYVLVLLFKRKKSIALILDCMAAMTLIQNYYSLDAMTLEIFERFNIGFQEIGVEAPLYIDGNGNVVSGEEAKVLVLSPYTLYNRQWSYFEHLMDKAFESIDYTEKDYVAMPDSFYPYTSGSYWGYWEDNYYDSVKKQVMQIFETRERQSYDLEQINYCLLTKDHPELPSGEGDGNVYYFSFSFSKEIDEEVLKNNPLVYIHEISFRGWKVDVYQLER